MKNRLLICFFLLLSFRGYSQCTLNVTLSQSDPVICSGNSVVLTATTSGGTAPFTFVWSTGETTSSISVNKAGTYTVSVTDKTPGCQPVKKSLTITTSTTPDAPTSHGVTVCSGSTATLTATAPGGTYQWYDAATGGNFLATGATYTTPPINSATLFYVQTTVANCTSPRTPVGVSVSGKPTVTGATTCQGNVATLMASGGDTYAWYDAASGGNLVGTDADYTTPPLAATKTYYVVVTSNGCTSARTPVTATVTSAPSPPTASNPDICSGSTAQLHATASESGVFDWFTVPSGGTSLISSPDYTTPSLTATTTYYVQITINDCVSGRVPVTVTVDSPPQAPATQTDTICYKTSATLTASASPSATYKWYDEPNAGNLLATGNTYNTPVLANSTAYYVEAINGSCTSLRAQVNVIVKPQLAAPSAPGAIICSGGVATLTASSSGDTYQWYDAATGGNLLSSAASYTTPALTANTTYYVQRMQDGCTSPRAAVTVTVLSPPAAPTAPNTSTCYGSSATLTASSPTNNYAWYDAATGGNLLSTGQVYVTPALTANTTYYVECSTANGCTSKRTAVTVTINPIPSPPTASATSVCPGTSASLTASAPSGSIQWYDSASGGNLLTTGNTYNTPALNAPTTYYVQNTVGQCVSSRTAVTVTIIGGADPQFQYPSGTFCVSSPNPTPVINNPAGGTFSAPAGLVFVSTTTGQINIGASTPGNYVVSFTNNAPCVHTTTAAIAIVNNSNASFSYGGPYCQDSGNPLPKYPAGSSGGTFTASPSGLVFVNTSTGEIDLSKSAANTYTITNTIQTSGSCPGSTATATVTINQEVTVSAGPDQTVPTGTTVQLAGSISGGITTGTWSGGAGSFSNTSSPTAVYTPGPGETVAKLTLTSDDPPGVCGPKSDKVTITFNSQPAAPTAQGATVCFGTSATLSATAPGGTYKWYDAATGGTLLATGPSFTTPALTANTTYYVNTTVGGITSSPTSVPVTVDSVLAAPTAPGTGVCTGTVATLTASGSAGTYEWYDAPAGGNLLSTNNPYVTPALTQNASYYVQSKLNSCTSTRTEVDVTVSNAPNVTSAATGVVCSNNAQNYTITADLPSATFNWSRAQVAGISNPAVTNQTSGTIAETLINTTTNTVNVTYDITPLAGTCNGPVFKYVVAVYPEPTVTSAAVDTVCDGDPDNYTVTFNTPGIDFSWSRAAVPGISNTPVMGQAAAIIKEVLFNTTNNPVTATYTFNYKTSSCAGTPFNLNVTVYPKAIVTSDSTGIACSGQPQDYVITSNIPSATFNWSRAAVPNISNPAVTNQTSGTITENLINTRSTAVTVVYNITPIANGCAGTPFMYTVTVNPTLNAPDVNSNTPVCTGSTIHLTTTAVPQATYMWTGPNGFISPAQNPDIPNATTANSGTYTLAIMVKGCTSPSDSVAVAVDSLPVADAGPDQVVCIYNPSVLLTGTISGGTTTGIWTTAGTGTFAQSSNTLKNQYIFSAADKTAGSVVLTLTSTSKDDCTPSVSSMTVRFGPLPAVNAGPDQEACSQDAGIQLDGHQFIPGNVQWTTSGTGTFSPSANQLNPTYMPSAADTKSGADTLFLNITGAGRCYDPADTMIIRYIPPPTVNAGGTRYVLKGRTITLYPTVSTDSVHYLWSPDIDINNDTLKNPVITGDVDRVYTLTVTDFRGCVSQDQALIKVAPSISVNNTFTPNGDGINDKWDITGLIAYVDATVDIFTRNGQKVFHSLGYPTPWDGTYDGKPLPAGVYYYVINTHYNGQVLSGYITIIK